MSFRRHIIKANTSLKSALALLNELAADAILFVVDEDEKLIGSITDGDVRRGVLKGLTIEDKAGKFLQPNPSFLRKDNYSVLDVVKARDKMLKVVPVLDCDDRIIDIVNFRRKRSYLPVDAVIMAGGRGKRLSPLTDNTPKPLLRIGDETIIEHNLNRLASYGIENFWITLGYLGHQVEQYFGNGERHNTTIKYVWEDDPLGTIGAVSGIKDFRNKYVLVTNSDLLTNIDYEQFFLNFLETEADLAMVAVPYQVSIPYAVLDIERNEVVSLKEKPTFTYYTNGGIYLMKKQVLELVPRNTFFNATDLVDRLIELGFKVSSYPLAGYWLDVGKPEDFNKAQQDIHQIKF